MPVDWSPPATVDGARLRAESAGGRTASVAVRLTLPSVAMIVAVDREDTGKVVTVNVAVVAPAATETEAGTVALPELDDNGIVAPAGGAGDAKVTVPVDEVPP